MRQTAVITATSLVITATCLFSVITATSLFSTATCLFSVITATSLVITATSLFYYCYMFHLCFRWPSSDVLGYVV